MTVCPNTGAAARAAPGPGGAGPARGCPQAVQKAAGRRISWPQWAQGWRKRVPHAAQKVAAAGFV